MADPHSDGVAWRVRLVHDVQPLGDEQFVCRVALVHVGDQHDLLFAGRQRARGGGDAPGVGIGQAPAEFGQLFTRHASGELEREAQIAVTDGAQARPRGRDGRALDVRPPCIDRDRWSGGQQSPLGT